MQNRIEQQNSTQAVMAALIRPVETSEVEALDDNAFVIVESDDDVPAELPISVPPNFPKNSRFLGRFTKLKRFQDGNESFHPTYTGFADGKKYYIKFNIDTGIKEGKKHYLIYESQETIRSDSSKSDPFLISEILSQLEVACWKWYKIAAPDVVSESVHPCFAYDEKENVYRFVAVASEEIFGFRPNRFDPLKVTDLRIDFLDNDLVSKCENLIKNLKDLSKSLDRYHEPASTLTSIWNYTKQTCISMNESFWGTTKSAISCKPIIDAFLQKSETKEGITQEDVQKLLPRLVERYKNVVNLCDYYKGTDDKATLKKYTDEANILKQAIENASPDIIRLEEIDYIVDQKMEREENKLLLEHPNANDNDIITVNLFNQIIKITIKELKNHCLIDKLKENTIISGVALDKSFSIKVSDIQHHRIKRRLAEDLVQSYVNAENDYHNKNGSKKGKRIDTDMSEWPFFSKFKEVNFAEWLKGHAEWLVGGLGRLLTWSEASKEFQFTQEDYEEFPNLKKDKRRYWPTESTTFAQVSQSKLVIPFFDNFYTSDDNKVFQMLAADPDFRFHADKQFLRNAVTPDHIYRKSIESDVRYDLFYLDPTANYTKKNLLDDAVNYKVNRMQSLKNFLYSQPRFVDYLKKYGDYAFSLIQRSVEKHKDDPDLKDLMTMEEMHKEYEKTLIATGLQSTQHEIKSSLSMQQH